MELKEIESKQNLTDTTRPRPEAKLLLELESSIRRPIPAHDSESIYEDPYSNHVNGPRKESVKGQRKASQTSSNDKSTHRTGHIIGVTIGLLIGSIIGGLVTGLLMHPDSTSDPDPECKYDDDWP